MRATETISKKPREGLSIAAVMERRRKGRRIFHNVNLSSSEINQSKRKKQYFNQKRSQA